MTKRAFILLSAVAIFLAGYCLGYNNRGMKYRKGPAIELLEALDLIPEEAARWVVKESKWNKTIWRLELLGTNDFQATNQFKKQI
ncbi:MAG: hypothetical protein ABI042_16885 [Verrucomicrobiota bacterium]